MVLAVAPRRALRPRSESEIFGLMLPRKISQSNDRLKNTSNHLKILATPAGFEPATFSLEGWREIVLDQR
jgi:hypothetical protein